MRRRYHAHATPAARSRMVSIATARAVFPATGRPPIAIADGDFRPSGDRGTSRQARHRGEQDNRVEEHNAAGLPATNQACGCADRGRLSCGDQHASSAPGALGRVRRRGQQGYGQPGVAQGERQLGCLECPPARRRTDCPLDPDGSVVRVRLDRKATSIALLVVLGVREDGQKVLLAVKNMEAWRAVLDDLVKRGLRKPKFLIVDGGTGLEQALAALWGDVPTSAVPSTSTATCSPTHPHGCMRKSQPTTPT